MTESNDMFKRVIVDEKTPSKKMVNELTNGLDDDIEHQSNGSIRSICTDVEVNYLSREDLLQIEETEPGWRRGRRVLLALFFIVWFGLLAAAILIIVFTEKCPPKPELAFWQSKIPYLLDPFAFKDSNGDFIGDFEGIRQEIPYISDTVGAGFVIFTSMLQGHYSANTAELGHITDFEKPDSSLGTMDDFRRLVKALHRKGLEVIIPLDINGIPTEHAWAQDASFLKPYPTTGTWTSWFSQYPSNQLFNTKSADIVQSFREVIDEYSDASSRSRKNVNSPTEEQFTLKNFNLQTNNDTTHWAFTTATDTDLRHNNVIATAAIFLLPGTPMVYYGTEFGLTLIDGTMNPPEMIYPKGKVPNMEAMPNDSDVTAQLPMPWDRSGKGFSSNTSGTDAWRNYLEQFEISETVVSATASGRGTTIFTMVKKLIELRKEPSLLWGRLEILQNPSGLYPESLEMFTRSAEGFPTFITIFNNPTTTSSSSAGVTVDLSGVCAKIYPKLVYPATDLSVDDEKPIEAENIYIITDNVPRVYVAQCA